MTSEFGSPLSGGRQPWGPPASPQTAPALPSRRTTVLVTAVLGLFGLIPATRDSNRARELGDSGGRYFTAFGLTFAATALAWACIAAVVLLTVAGTGDPAGPSGATAASDRTDELKAKGQQVDGEWTVEGLVQVLQSFADDEYSEAGEDNAFTGTVGALVPCAGQQEHGLAPDRLATTIGGYGTPASAQILPDAASAQRELARQTALLQGCAAGYEVTLEDGSLVTCVLSIQTLAPAVRYEGRCDGESGKWVAAFFQADNAVVTILTNDNSQMDWTLPALMGELDAD